MKKKEFTLRKVKTSKDSMLNKAEIKKIKKMLLYTDNDLVRALFQSGNLTIDNKDFLKCDENIYITKNQISKQTCDKVAEFLINKIDFNGQIFYVGIYYYET